AGGARPVGNGRARAGRAAGRYAISQHRRAAVPADAATLWLLLVRSECKRQPAVMARRVAAATAGIFDPGAAQAARLPDAGALMAHVERTGAAALSVESALVRCACPRRPGTRDVHGAHAGSDGHLPGGGGGCCGRDAQLVSAPFDAVERDN